MQKNNHPGREEVAIADHEEVATPGPRAELQIDVGPPPKQWGSAKANVPADQAHHLITTSGILGSAATGIGGAAFTLQAVSGAVTLAYAELALAFVAAVLIAVCGRMEPSSKDRREKPDTPSADMPAREAAAGPGEPGHP
jgi:hypothetical protein